MVLKTKEIEIEGRKIIIKELSVDDQFSLTEVDKFTVREYYRKCMSEEDYTFVLALPVREFRKIKDIVNELNKDNTLGDDSDFPESLPKKE